MDGETLTWIFLSGGLLLMILEAILPGGVAFFLGLTGLGVGILRYLGFLSDPVTAITIWLISSVGLTIAIRPFIKKYLKPESSTKYADEDYEAMDQVVEVVEPLTDKDNSGRIRFDGISWNARSLEGNVKKGEKVRIRYRENTTWIVEPMGIIEPAKERKRQSNKRG
ncbi:MAG: NfeD family protein [Balneolaceae bacterium]